MMIEISRLTKDFGSGRGVFGLDFSVGEGEVFGFLGPNGAGKTTTIRCLMGFLHPGGGSCSISGKNCFRDAAQIQKDLGYLPGEIAFPDGMTGEDLIHFQAKMRGLADLGKARRLAERFELDTKNRLRKMSKGNKQKVGLVCAFLHDPAVLVLDEPTSGLDPLMQNRFVELILEEKKAGKTILMSSHQFEEVERTCDRIGMIKEGRLLEIAGAQTLRRSKKKLYLVTLENEEEARRFASGPFPAEYVQENTAAVSLTGDFTPLAQWLAGFQVKSLDIKRQSLEETFLSRYGDGKFEA